MTIARLLGEAWCDQITGGKGTYHNCNAKKRQYQYEGIGKVHCEDMTKFSNLTDYVLPYLMKQDFYLRMVIPKKGSRTFGHGITPQPKVKKRGRPRTKIAA